MKQMWEFDENISGMKIHHSQICYKLHRYGRKVDGDVTVSLLSESSSAFFPHSLGC